MSKQPDLRILRKVRICTMQNPLVTWEDYLSDAEIRAYQLSGHLVVEVDG